MEQRKVGRPAKGVAEVGKQGLIQRARDALRLRRYDFFQRKELAAACGVTPALLTYHFRSSDEIFEAVIVPVLADCHREVHRIAGSGIAATDKYSLVVKLLIDTLSEDKNIFDVFEYAIAMGLSKTPDYVSLIKNELKVVGQDCFKIGMPGPIDQMVFHGAVWGMCQAAATYQRGDTTPPAISSTFSQSATEHL